jgi:hypothetical protein
MQSIQESQCDSKREAMVMILNRVLLLIEHMWCPHTMDRLLRERLSGAHRALGQLRDELEIGQTVRIA